MSENPMNITVWACIKCREPEFWNVINVQYQVAIDNEHDCKRLVCDYCGIESRSELSMNTRAAELFWIGFIKPYELYRRQRGAA